MEVSKKLNGFSIDQLGGDSERSFNCSNFVDITIFSLIVAINLYLHGNIDGHLSQNLVEPVPPQKYLDFKQLALG